VPSTSAAGGKATEQRLLVLPGPELREPRRAVATATNLVGGRQRRERCVENLLQRAAELSWKAAGTARSGPLPPPRASFNRQTGAELTLESLAG
jgi:hypothetical protein